LAKHICESKKWGLNENAGRQSIRQVLWENFRRFWPAFFCPLPAPKPHLQKKAAGMANGLGARPFF
jgi:hypothetical protein